MFTWLLAAVQMFLLNPLAPQPDVAALRYRQASLHAERCRAAQVFSTTDFNLLEMARDSELLQNTPLGVVAVPEDDLQRPVLLSPSFSLIHFKSSTPPCYRYEDRQRGNQLGLFPGRNPFHILDFASSFVLSPGGSDPETLREVEQKRDYSD